MNREDRLLKISQVLKTEEKVSTDVLAENFDVSLASIRRDLDELEHRGIAKKVYGGAIYLEDASKNNKSSFRGPIFDINLGMQIKEKEAIGRVAATLIDDGDTIMIDGGTTTLQVLSNLTNRHNLTIITCSFASILKELANIPDMQIFVTGGFLRGQTLTLLGEEAENMIRKFRANKTILGIDAVSIDQGFTTMNFLEAAIKKTMIKSTSELIVVVDHTKFGKVCPLPVADIRQAQTIVTDSDISHDIIADLNNLGVKVITAEI